MSFRNWARSRGLVSSNFAKQIGMCQWEGRKSTLAKVGNTSAEALRHHSHSFWLHVAQRRLFQLRIHSVRNSEYVQKQLAEIYGAQVVVQRNYGRA